MNNLINTNRLSFKSITQSASMSSILSILSFTLLTIVASHVIIPIKPVPMTLQTVAVVLSGALLGWKKGAISQIAYLTLGVLGLPVFAPTPDAAMGLFRLFGPTGGYLLAFPLGAIVAGLLVAKSKSSITVLASMFVANLVVVLFGALYLDTFFVHNMSETLKVGALVFSVWSVLKVAVTFGIFKSLRKVSE